jgi:hypothetical protein
MRRFAPFLLLILVTGCASAPVERDNAEVLMFGPTRMRLHPIFTQVKDWTGDNIADGIEAEVEFQDQFDDPTKAAGKIMFELYAYRQGFPDPRGDRIVNPWVGSLLTLQQQREHWNRTSRTYSFQLAMPGISLKRTYVLTAMFENGNGRRFFSRLILNPQQPDVSKSGPPRLVPMPTTVPTPMPTPAPTTVPATGPSELNK